MNVWIIRGSSVSTKLVVVDATLVAAVVSSVLAGVGAASASTSAGGARRLPASRSRNTCAAVQLDSIATAPARLAV